MDLCHIMSTLSVVQDLSLNVEELRANAVSSHTALELDTISS